jgi:hypothetical protein
MAKREIQIRYSIQTSNDMGGHMHTHHNHYISAVGIVILSVYTTFELWALLQLSLMQSILGSLMHIFAILSMQQSTKERHPVMPISVLQAGLQDENTGSMYQKYAKGSKRVLEL